jgi:RNA polymerase sigma-70 factor (ECF subfamily)
MAMEDERVVEEILRGNREAFRMLVLRYERPLFRFLGLLGFDGTACEDLAQQTFLSAFRALADFDASRARFSTWLFTIAKRHAAHERERAHRRHETSSTEATEARARSTGPDPAEAASLSQRVRTLEAALRSLPQELRSTFLLSQIKELSLEEVAAVENCPLGTVKSRIHRARERLRLALDPMETP